MAGSGASGSREIVREIIRAVEEDRELRYLLMGVLGFRELLDRFARLEERQQRLEERQQKLEEQQLRLEERQQALEEKFAELGERFARLEERFAGLEERVTRLEERFAQLEARFLELEERFAKLEERVARLEERVTRLEERVTRLEERFADLEERVMRVEEELRNLNRMMAAVLHRFGMLSESGFRDAMRYVVEEVFGVAEVTRWVEKDEEGIVYGRPSVIEVDVLVKDNVHVLLEIKSRVSKSDVAELHRIGRLYEKKTGIRPRLAIVGGFVDEGALELARGLGVEVYPVVEARVVLP